MIQRKQTVFLLIAAILALVVVFARLQPVDALQLASAVLSVVTIVQYKHRPRQAVLCLVNLLHVLAWYVCVAAIERVVSTLEALPMVEAILILLARKGIIDDEKLVRSVDRIR